MKLKLRTKTIFFWGSLLCFSLGKLSVCLSQSQGKWQQWETIYQDKQIKVELQYYYSFNGCDPNGKPFKYRGRVTGTYYSTPMFVNFKTDNIDCNGNLYYIQNAFDIGAPVKSGTVSDLMDESIDYRILSCDSIYKTFYDVEIGSIKKNGSGLKALPLSKNPTAIDGKQYIYYGESTTLKVRGGALGIGADWVWYQGGCNLKRVGTGSSIVVSPTDSITYFVRAEGSNNTTSCVSIHMNVDKRSSDPSGITGSNKICAGTKTSLSVTGGSLGQGAQWIWYANNCGGKQIGIGNSISINPSQLSTYYVRAEGPYNVTNCSSITVDVIDQSSDPMEIKLNINKSNICDGAPIELSVKGGRLAKDADWYWYSGSCTGYEIGTGNSIQRQASSGTYFVKAKGFCNETVCISTSITTIKKSFKSGSIITSGTAFKGKKLVLSTSGGILGDNANWVWYKDNCKNGAYLGKGSSITIKPRNKSMYFVRAEGTCNVTDCSEIEINPIKVHKFDKTYNAFDGNKKFLHIGYGLGLEYTEFSDISRVNYYNGSGDPAGVGFDSISISALGLKGELVFYPIMKEFFSLGIIGGFTVGTASSIFTGFKRTGATSGRESYFYTKINLGTEMALGFKNMKFLFKINKIIQPNQYSLKPEGSFANKNEYEYQNTIKSEVLSSGLRFGRYARKKSGTRGDNFDLYYSLWRGVDQPILKYEFDEYRNFNQWNVGGGLSWWKQSRFKLQFDFWFNIKQSDFNYSDPDFSRAFFNLSLIINQNFFY